MSDRVREVVPDMLAAIHEVLERHRVTEEEWFGALAFLGEIAKADELILLSDVTQTSVLIDALSHDGDGAGPLAPPLGKARIGARVNLAHVCFPAPVAFHLRGIGGALLRRLAPRIIAAVETAGERPI